MSSDPLMLTNLEKVTGAELKQLQKRTMVLMQQDDDPSKFPGSQPVSFERRHLTPPMEGGGGYVSLLASPYFAAEKTDGVRYMLLILGGKGAFMIDRNFDMRRLPPMRFPSRADPNVALDSTLLDGELIAERGGTGQPLGATEVRLRYLAYDACRVAGKACCDEPLRLRFMAMRREVLSPRFILSQTEPQAFADEPFTVELKDFFALPQLPHIFSRVSQAPPDANILYAFEDPLRKLSHGNDGIIFTPANDPYRPYTCPALLKWKPANMNSVDFKLMCKWRREGDNPAPQPRFVLCVASSTLIEPYCWITFSDEDYERFSKDPLRDTRIVECVYDPTWHVYEYNPDDSQEPTWDNPVLTPGGWRFERIREDKKLPNDKSTVRSIQQSVRDGVSAPELLQTLNLQHMMGPRGLGAFAPPGWLAGPGGPPGS